MGACVLPLGLKLLVAWEDRKLKVAAGEEGSAEGLCAYVLFGILGGNFLTGNPSQQRVAAAEEKRPSGRHKPEA